MFALWLAVYLEAIFGLLGLGAASRAVAQGGARFIIWQKAIKASLMTLDDAAQIAKGVIRAKSKNKSVQPKKGFDWIGFLIIAFGLFFLISTVLSPIILDTSYEEVLLVLAQELKPW